MGVFPSSPDSGPLSIVWIRPYFGGMYGYYAPLYGRVGVQSTCCTHDGRASTVLSAREDKILLLSVTVVIEAQKRGRCDCLYGPTPRSYYPPPQPYSLFVHTRTALVNEIIIVLSNLVLVFPLIVILVRNTLMNVSLKQECCIEISQLHLWT